MTEAIIDTHIKSIPKIAISWKSAKQPKKLILMSEIVQKYKKKGLLPKDTPDLKDEHIKRARALVEHRRRNKKA